jgi:hypothetical protein
MITFLVAVHILVDTQAAGPSSAVAAALENQFDRCAAAVPAAGTIVDWAVAGEDLAASMAPVVIPADYTPGATPFPDGTPRESQARNNDPDRPVSAPIPHARSLSADTYGCRRN